MKGSMIASMIESEMRREKFYKNKTKKKFCEDMEKQCYKCKIYYSCKDRGKTNGI